MKNSWNRVILCAIGSALQSKEKMLAYREACRHPTWISWDMKEHVLPSFIMQPAAVPHGPL